MSRVRFASVTPIFAELAQLDRVAAFEAVGQGFESLIPRQHILDKILGTSETSNILNKKVESVDAEQ